MHPTTIHIHVLVAKPNRYSLTSFIVKLVFRKLSDMATNMQSHSAQAAHLMCDFVFISIKCSGISDCVLPSFCPVIPSPYPFHAVMPSLTPSAHTHTLTFYLYSFHIHRSTNKIKRQLRKLQNPLQRKDNVTYDKQLRVRRAQFTCK